MLIQQLMLAKTELAAEQERTGALKRTIKHLEKHVASLERLYLTVSKQHADSIVEN